jgi:predicted dehydrogenase
MDIGCYCISLSRFIFAAEPRRVLGIVEYDPQFKTDRLASGILDFGRGTSTFTCSTQVAPYQRVHIVGTQGRVEIEIPFNTPTDVPCLMWHQSQGMQSLSGDSIEKILLPVANQYTLQGDLFSQAVLDDTPVPTPLEDAVNNMKVIEAVFNSHAERGWVAVE